MLVASPRRPAQLAFSIAILVLTSTDLVVGGRCLLSDGPADVCAYAYAVTIISFLLTLQLMLAMVRRGVSLRRGRGRRGRGGRGGSRRGGRPSQARFAWVLGSRPVWLRHGACCPLPHPAVPAAARDCRGRGGGCGVVARLRHHRLGCAACRPPASRPGAPALGAPAPGVAEPGCSTGASRPCVALEGSLLATLPQPPPLKPASCPAVYVSAMEGAPRGHLRAAVVGLAWATFVCHVITVLLAVAVWR